MKRFLFILLCFFPLTCQALTKIGIVGDRFCMQYPVPPCLNLVYLLDKKLHQEGYPTRLINYSTYESTMVEGIQCFNKMLAEDKPDILVVLLGYNDASQMIPIEHVKIYLAHLIELATAHHIPVIVGTVDVSSLPWFHIPASYLTQFKDLYEELAIDYPHAMFFPYLSKTLFTTYPYYNPENLLPTEVAHAWIADQLAALLKCLIAPQGVNEAASPVVNIGLIGDSICVPFPLATYEALGYLLERDLEREGYPVRIINYSIGCARTDTAPTRLVEMILTDKPQIVILTVGINDVRWILPFEHVRNNLIEAIKIAQAYQIKVLIGIIDPAGLPSNPQPSLSYLACFKSLYAEIAFLYPHVFFFFFLNPEILLDFNYQIGDFVHPNRAGHEKIVESLKPILKAILVPV